MPNTMLDFSRFAFSFGDLHRLSFLCVSGLVLAIAGCTSSPSAKAPAPATSVSNEEVTRYATAVLKIESSRQAAVSDIQRMTQDDKVPLITCTEPTTIKNLAKDVQAIVVNYCKESKQAGESNGLSMTRFNAITLGLASNTELTTRIQTELARLQAPASAPAPAQSPNESPTPVSPIETPLQSPAPSPQ